MTFATAGKLIAEQLNSNALMGNSGGRSGGAKWNGGLSTYQEGLDLDHFTRRQNTRDASHDSSTARALINRKADAVAGTGIRLEAAPKNRALGITLEEAEEWAQNVGSLFDSFAQSKRQCRSENMNLYQASRFNAVQNRRDGESLIRLWYSQDRTLLNPVQFDFIDPNQLRGTGAWTSTLGPMSQNDGIKRDSRGRAISYKIWVKINGEYKERTIPAVGKKSGRKFMLHQFQPEYPGQGRGIPSLSNALQDLENITDFNSAQIKKAINQSSVDFYTKPSDDAPASNVFADLVNKTTAGPIPATTPSTSQTEEYDPSVSYNPIPEATYRTPGEMAIFGLQAGEDFLPFSNTAPSDGFGVFVNDFTSYLAAAEGVPLEVLLMKFNSNYSASRAALLLFWNVALIERQEQVYDFLNPVYEMWLSEEIARGTIKAPGWTNPVIKAAWLNARWIGPSMPNIDPLKTAAADKEYIEIGATTQDRVASEYNGSDGSTNRATNTRVYKETATPSWKITQGANNG